MLVKGNLNPPQVPHQLLVCLHAIGIIAGATAVSIAVPEHVDIGQVAFGLPGRGIDRQVDPCLVHPWLGAKNPVAQLSELLLVFKGHTLLGRLLNHMLANEIFFQRFIQNIFWGKGNSKN